MTPTTHVTLIGQILSSSSRLSSRQGPRLTLSGSGLLTSCHHTRLKLSSRDLLDYLGPRGHLDGTRLIIDRVKPEDKGVYRWDTGHLFKMGLRDEYSFTVFRWYICQFFKMAVREEFSFIKKDSDKEMGLYLWARCASFFSRWYRLSFHKEKLWYCELSMAKSKMTKQIWF